MKRLFPFLISASLLFSCSASDTSATEDIANPPLDTNVNQIDTTSPEVDASGPQPDAATKEINESNEWTLTFQVDMGSNYSGGATIGNSVQGWDTAGMVQLVDEDGDGTYLGSMKLEANTVIEYKFIKGYDGSGTWEEVPLSCGLQTDSYINRVFTMPAQNHTLDLTPYGGCPDQTIEPPLPPPSVCGDAPGRATPVTIEGRKVMVGTSPIHMKGVAWSPMPIGQAPGNGGSDFAGNVAQDAALMAAAGINVVRTYGPINNEAVLDALWAQGIYVLMTVYYGYSETPETTIEKVCSLKEHPAILGWVVGNEWNYNMLGKNISLDEALAEVASVVKAIKENDTTRPVSTIYGHVPPSDIIAALSDVDVWGLNVYTGTSFGDLFEQWASLSTKPFFLGEYGSDAFNGIDGLVDETMQAGYVDALTKEINANASVNGSGVCAGGMVFEFNDEWWKFSGGSPWEHDTGSSWENGAYSDPGMHEEWWGLVDIDRTPREAYEAYKSIQAPTP
jgi:hypothetical protein